MSHATEPMSVGTSPNHKKKWFWIASFLFLGLGFICFFYWVFWGRFSESTNDCYVNGNLILLTPLESGIVTSIYADNAQLVEAGQPLIEFDRHDYEIALEGAKANLADAVRHVTQMFYRVGELKAQKEVARSNLIRANLDYEHRKALVDDSSVSREDFEHSETSLSGAWASLSQVDQQLAAAIAEVENTTIATHPRVEQAKSKLRQAFLDLKRCVLVAPVRGIVTQRRAQVGQWMRPGDSLLALVPLDQIWVEANFRETDLKHLRIDQPVEMITDMYGSGIKFHGRVVGLNPGTGSIFSILPSQNATGNWIKIIQRVPVKIALDPKEIQLHPLVLGLSMKVCVDTHQRQGARLPAASCAKPIYETDVYKEELAGADEMIAEIIAQNTAGEKQNLYTSPKIPEKFLWSWSIPLEFLFKELSPEMGEILRSGNEQPGPCRARIDNSLDPALKVQDPNRAARS